MFGDHAQKQRAAIVSDFKAAEGAAVMFMGIKVGGVGLNLPEARHVIFYEPPWTDVQLKNLIALGIPRFTAAH